MAIEGSFNRRQWLAGASSLIGGSCCGSAGVFARDGPSSGCTTLQALDGALNSTVSQADFESMKRDAKVSAAVRRVLCTETHHQKMQTSARIIPA